MRIGYFADGPWSHQALDRILATPELSVAFIVARFTSADPVLKQYADSLQIPYILHPNVNDPQFLDWVKAQEVDLLVSMSFDQILKPPMLTVAPLGFINCHAGALPFYRGRNVLNWALINGESSFGVTVHYIDEGIDTGDIILQRHCPIAHHDDYASVLEKAYILCADTLHEALTLLASGQATRMKQSSIHPVGFYCCQRKPGDEWLDWGWPSERLYNFIRALTIPGPGARTWLQDRTVAILRADMIPDSPAYLGRPGEVVGRDPLGVLVKTGDTCLRILQVAFVDELGLSETQSLQLPIGTRFIVDPWHELALMKQRLAQLERIN